MKTSFKTSLLALACAIGLTATPQAHSISATAAAKNAGVQLMLDYTVDFLPSPLDVGAMKGTDVDDHSKILERAPSSVIENQAIADCMITMKQDGYLKVIEGITTMEEVWRVAQD